MCPDVNGIQLREFPEQGLRPFIGHGGQHQLRFDDQIARHIVSVRRRHASPPHTQTGT